MVRQTADGVIATSVLSESMMFTSFAIVAVALLLVTSDKSGATTRQAEQAPKPVTNADVVSMTAAKLSDDVIVGAVQQAAITDFDLSPEALIALRNTDVSDRVIKAMQARPKSQTANGANASLTGDPTEPGTQLPPSEPCRIFITEEEPPSGAYVVVRKEVQAGKKFYGSHDDNLMKELAKRAEKVGADAIVKFHEWRAPSMWSWAAAKAGGMAVKWTAGQLANSARRDRKSAA